MTMVIHRTSTQILEGRFKIVNTIKDWVILNLSHNGFFSLTSIKSAVIKHMSLCIAILWNAMDSKYKLLVPPHGAKIKVVTVFVIFLVFLKIPLKE